MKTTNEKVSKLASDFDQVIEKVHLALQQFVKGDPEPMKLMFSHPTWPSFSKWNGKKPGSAEGRISHRRLCVLP